MNPAVIFDMDGVLADTYAPHFVSWQRLYEGLGIPYGESDFAADFGRTSRDILRRMLGAELTDDQIREFDGAKESHFRDIIRETPASADGAQELIDSLLADGFAIAVGSSGPPENVWLMLEQLERAKRFGAVVTGTDVTRGKPDPQVFQLAAERLERSLSECVVVEDALHGVEAAHNAGMKCIAVAGTLTVEQLRPADRVVTSLRQIGPALIRELLSR